MTSAQPFHLAAQVHAYRSSRQIVDALLSWEPPETESTPEPMRAAIPGPELDIWTLNSNLHKAVRLGQTAVAMDTARALYHRDAAYCLRRLPVVALEEVSFGDLGVCLDTLVLTRPPVVDSVRRGERLAAYVACRLAGAVRCAVTRDLLAILEGELGSAFWTRARGLDPSLAFRQARDPALPWSQRALALLRLDAMSTRGRDTRGRMLQLVARAFDLPPLIADTLVAGHSTYGFGAMLPMAWLLLDGQPLAASAASTEAPDLVGPGLLTCSLDDRTRVGRMALHQWMSSVEPLRAYWMSSPEGDDDTRRRERAVRLAVSTLEDRRIHRQLTGDALLALREQAVSEQFRCLGIDDDTRVWLVEVVRRALPALHQFRRELFDVFGRTPATAEED